MVLQKISYENGENMFQDAINEIREALPGMTPQQRKIGSYFCEHPETVGVLSLGEFVEKIGTSAPTMSRFCQSLGYSGFLDFSKAMQTLRNNEISHATFFHNTRIHRNRNNDPAGMAHALIKKEMGNLNRLLENYPVEKVGECVSLMKQCATIAIIGDMSAYPATIYFEQLLSKITPKLIPMSGPSVLQAAAISRLDKNSLVFCMAFPRYPKAVVELSRDAAQKGAVIVAITDNELSPLAEISNILLPVEVDLFSYIDLFGAVFTLVNVICMEFGLAQGLESEHSLAKYDRTVAGTYLVPGFRTDKKAM